MLKKILPARTYARYFGRHERGSLRTWKHIAKRLGPQDVILDIGAFHGEYAISARLVNSRVGIYAFEPNPGSARTLRDKSEGLDIRLVENAVAHKSGRVEFVLSSATSHLATSNRTAEGQIISVNAVSLDDWVKAENLCIALIKIDVEAKESEVLCGSKSLLEQDQPLILCEVLSDEAGQEVMKALPATYLYFHIDENRGVSLRASVDRKHWRNKNWLFVPGSKTYLLDDIV